MMHLGEDIHCCVNEHIALILFLRIMSSTIGNVFVFYHPKQDYPIQHSKVEQYFQH